MRFFNFSKLLRFFHLGLVAGCLLPNLAQAQATQEYATLFTEEVLTVNRERDGLLPGTLRTALIQASGIRAHNSFTLVRIVFAPQVRRVQITKGPLPEIDGSLTTLDCAHPKGRVVLEYIAPEDDAGQDPSLEPTVLTITSNGNTVRNCHLTGAPGPGILIQGNRNVIEQNAIGYHAATPQTAVPPSALFGAPKSNGKSGILLSTGANENQIYDNDIMGNPYHGVLLEKDTGHANRIYSNTFAKNKGQPIKTEAGGKATTRPQIQKITRHGDRFLIQGTTAPGAKVEIYLAGSEKGAVEMLVAQGSTEQNQRSPFFTVVTKSKGFVPGKTRLTALAHRDNQNTSEFSEAQLIQQPKPLAPSQTANVESKDESTNEEVQEELEFEEEEELENPQARRPFQERIPPPHHRPPPPSPQGSRTGELLGDTESDETFITIRGHGEGNAEPDRGDAGEQRHESHSFGL